MREGKRQKIKSNKGIEEIHWKKDIMRFVNFRWLEHVKHMIEEGIPRKLVLAGPESKGNVEGSGRDY